MEHYRRLGLAEQIRTFGLPADHPTDVGYFTTLAGIEVARLRMPSEAEKMQAVQRAEPADQIVEPIFRCNQMYVERFLFDKVQAAKHIDSRFGWECVEWQDFGDRVEVRAVETATSREEIFEGEYLVGCDGGNSTVRRKLGIRYSGEPAREQLWAGGLTASTFLRAPEFYHKAISRHPLLAVFRRQPSGTGQLSLRLMAKNCFCFPPAFCCAIMSRRLTLSTGGSSFAR